MALFPFTTLADVATVIPSASFEIPITATDAALYCVSLHKVADDRPFVCLVHEVLVHQPSFFTRFVCFHLVSLWFVGISAVAHLMSIILVPFQMFVKYRLFVKTLSGYNFLFGVSVGYWLALVGLYRDCIGVL